MQNEQESDGVWAGIDIGGTKTAVVLSTSLPDVMARREFATLPHRGPHVVVAEIICNLREMVSTCNVKVEQLVCIGVSCGSPLDANAGRIQNPPNLPTWVDVPIVEWITRELGVPCRLENDANAGAIAEYRYGAGRRASHMIFLTMGTGLGAGIIIHGRLVRGARGLAGEIGHVRITEYGPLGYGKAGSAEGWASGQGMAQLARNEIAAAARWGERTALAQLNGNLTAKDIASAAKAHDPVALRVVEESGRKLGAALAILIDLINPEKIVIGGMAMRLGSLLLNPARAVIAREALPESARICEIVPAELDERIGDVAALCVAAGDY